MVHLTLRRRQRIVLQNDVPEHAFMIEDGCLTLDSVLPEDRRQIMLVLYPGDIITRSAAPPVPLIGFTALRPSIVARRRESDFVHQARQNEGITAFANLAARAGLHAMSIGRLSGEERLATLMIEMVLRLGQSTPGGRTLEMPLSRNDMADYLALNPDTLSRLMSRLRSRGVLSMPNRSRVIVRDFDALAKLSPLADALHLICTRPTPSLFTAAKKTEDAAC